MEIGLIVLAVMLATLLGLVLAVLVALASLFEPRGGSRLVLFGVAATVVELRKIRGLVPLGEEDRAEHHDGLRDRQLFEVVVSANSPLISSRSPLRSDRRPCMYSTVRR